jgi:histidyl-tRNA synthetase
MIGRFLGTEVPATGFSLGFERLVDLVEPAEGDEAASVALVHDAEVPLARLISLQQELLAGGNRVRLVRRAKNTKPQLDGLAAEGFTSFAFVGADATDIDSLELRPLS